ncbi:MAG TPA: phosphoadenosine phosphosulfate reductase family protein [Bacteroidales bacterium]|nr:phosphoadenosine phosphosulfate reductase family protein [Bacteroidales bacterium]HRX96336.1 phosphoadenosine phosphosulfate reductase family protein [Bacteroidales bacterium]
MKKVRHLLGISGGKDSAALAIYMKMHYPDIDMEYYFCDTGKELAETYDLIEELENYLGKEITKLIAAKDSPLDPFDHFLQMYRGYLPSNQARWCTKVLKLEPFEKYVGDDPVISYVAIRGDEEREGYVSTKPNIQTIFPFRKNMWSIEVLNKVLHNDNISKLLKIYQQIAKKTDLEKVSNFILEPTSPKFLFSQKLNELLSIDTATFNRAVFQFLRDSNYPIAKLEDYSLLNNDDVIVKDDVINLYKSSGVTYPKYYKEVEYEVNGEKGKYARSRSGCFFCFYQQKIEWVWLMERHKDLFEKAMEYEKDGYTWNENESLFELSQPDRIQQIKEEHLKKIRNRILSIKSNKLIDVLDDADGISCVNCFV